MEEDFTSGPWTGFYTYWNDRRERMDLSLTFRQGVVTGSGPDPVGPFTIQGRYDAESNEIHWTKTYPGRHDVFYKGCRDNRDLGHLGVCPPAAEASISGPKRQWRGGDVPRGGRRRRPGPGPGNLILAFGPPLATIRNLMKTSAARYYWYWYPR